MWAPATPRQHNRKRLR